LVIKDWIANQDASSIEERIFKDHQEELLEVFKKVNPFEDDDKFRKELRRIALNEFPEDKIRALSLRLAKSRKCLAFALF